VTAAPAASRPRGRRVVVGTILGLLGIAAGLHPIAFALLVSAIAFACLYELANIADVNATPMARPVAFTATGVYLVLTYFGLIHRYEGTLLSVTVVATLAYCTLVTKGGYITRSATTLLGVLYIGKLLSYFITVRDLPQVGGWLTIVLIVAIAGTDIAAMLVGTTIGRTPLSPLSPRKTVEGAVGGFVIATAAAAVTAAVVPLHLPWWQGLLIGAITSASAQAGDLVESAIKRDARVKDAGTALGGGTGGVLDRFDSYVFGGIGFYFALFAVGIVGPVK
jgi:phosphatidate cytidylyltransferase